MSPRRLVFLVPLSALIAACPASAEPTIAYEARFSRDGLHEWVKFGYSLDLEVGMAIIGAPRRHTNNGTATFFERSGGLWSEGDTVQIDPGRDDNFGWSVAISGSRSLVGAYTTDRPTSMAGEAHIFVRDGEGHWVFEETLSAFDEREYAYFGSSVDLEGDRALIGAHMSDAQGPNVGAAYIFSRGDAGWALEARLSHPTLLAQSFFGSEVDLDGLRAAVSAPSDDALVEDGGAVFLFTESGGLWSLEEALTSPEPAVDEEFGKAIALDGDQLLVGSLERVYFYTAGAEGWSLEETIEPVAPGEQFGGALALSGDYALIGAHYADGQAGAVYLYLFDGLEWQLEVRLEPPEELESIRWFGFAVALDGALALIGAPGTNAPEDKAAFLYDLTALGLVDGEPCPGDYPCHSGHCVDGVCCESECGGGSMRDCEACSTARGASVDGVCGVVPEGWRCRSSAGDCDLSEDCDGLGRACPEDARVPAGVLCRPAEGVCDQPERCDGESTSCPENEFRSSEEVCRPAIDLCDRAETCPGDGPSCPRDGVASPERECRPSSGPCDQPEACDGETTSCPPDELLPAEAVCRPPAGPCDVAEVCDGESASCPPDELVEAGAECRPAAGVCDLPERCSGVGPECPEDELAPAGALCRLPTGSCDGGERCSGEGPACPEDDPSALDGLVCDDGLSWTIEDACRSGRCSGEALGTCERPILVEALPYEDRGDTSERPLALEELGPGCPDGERASEVVYEVDLEVGEALDAALEPSLELDPRLLALEACSEGARCLDASDGGGAGEPEALSLVAEEAMTVIIVVAAGPGGGGPFTLRLTLDDGADADADLDADLDIDRDVDDRPDAGPGPEADLDDAAPAPGPPEGGCSCSAAAPRAEGSRLLLVSL